MPDRPELLRICLRYPAVRDAWDKVLEVSPHITAFHRGSTAAVHHGLYGETIFLPKRMWDMLCNYLKTRITLRELFDAIPQCMIGHVDIVALRDLIARGFLAPRGWDHRRILREFMRSSRTNADYSNLTLFLTTGCNLRCSYCFLHENTKGRRRVMSFKLFCRALDAFSPSPNHAGPGRSIQFFGGEPLMEKELLRKMVEEIRRREARGYFGKDGIGIHLLTNGTLLDDDWFSFIDRHRVHLSISVDGTRRVNERMRSGADRNVILKSALSQAKRAQKAGIDVTISTFLCAQTAIGIPSFISSLSRHHGLHDFQLNVGVGDVSWQRRFYDDMNPTVLARVFEHMLDIPGVCIDPLTDHWRSFERQRAAPFIRTCQSGERLCVFPDGKAAPCPSCIDVRNRPGLSPRKQLMKSPLWSRFKETVQAVSEPCDSCSLWGFCNGGCPLNRFYFRHGKVLPDCIVSRAMLSACVWRYHSKQQREKE